MPKDCSGTYSMEEVYMCQEPPGLERVLAGVQSRFLVMALKSKGLRAFSNCNEMLMKLLKNPKNFLALSEGKRVLAWVIKICSLTGDD